MRNRKAIFGLLLVIVLGIAGVSYWQLKATDTKKPNNIVEKSPFIIEEVNEPSYKIEGETFISNKYDFRFNFPQAFFKYVYEYAEKSIILHTMPTEKIGNTNSVSINRNDPRITFSVDQQGGLDFYNKIYTSNLNAPVGHLSNEALWNSKKISSDTIKGIEVIGVYTETAADAETEYAETYSIIWAKDNKLFHITLASMIENNTFYNFEEIFLDIFESFEME